MSSLSVCLSLRPSSVRPSVCLCIRLSVCVFCPSARPYVYVYVRGCQMRIHRSNAACSRCLHWKVIADEKWKGPEVDDARRRGWTLLCKACKEKGCTKRSPKPFKCEGCRQELGRDHFDGRTLKNANSRGDLIVCSLCQKREREILYTIDALDATGCRCSSTWRHKENCSFLRKNKIRVRRTDLEWLAFRPKNRRPKIQEIAYYRALSLLLE